MARFKIMIIVEERTGNDLGDELVDYGTTIGWTDDEEAMAVYVAHLDDLCRIIAPQFEVATNDPNWWTDDEKEEDEEEEMENVE